MESAILHPETAPGASVDIARQHQALRLEISELRGVIGSCPAPQRTERYHQLIAVLVGRLGERLRLHAAAEEDGDLATLALAGPAPAAAVNRLRRAHVDLVAEAYRLIDVLRAPLAPPDAVAQVLHWLEALCTHEADELDLLRGNDEH